MSVSGVSSRRVLTIATVIAIGGIIIIGFTIALNPPTSDIPEPSFSYSNLNNLFRYYNNTQGVAVTNFLEFHLSFENIQDGSAFLRLTSATITIWVADITTHQPDNSLMQFNPFGTVLRCNLSRNQNQLEVLTNNATNDEWCATGTCQVTLGTTELLPGNVILVDYGFMLDNDLAKEYYGHQFLVKIQANVTYGALYLGGIIGWQYQSATYEYVLGEESPIYMLPVET